MLKAELGAEDAGVEGAEERGVSSPPVILFRRASSSCARPCSTMPERDCNSEGAEGSERRTKKKVKIN